MSFRTAAQEIRWELQREMGHLVVVEARKRLPAVPTREEILALLRTARDPRDHLIVRLFYATGIRLAELVTLCFCDIAASARSIFIRSGKGDRDRYVTADPHTFELLAEWQDGKPPAASVFGIGARQVERLVVEYGDQIGLVEKYNAMDRSFSPHSIRHTFATHCYDNGMDLITLKQLMGHQFLETTEIYIKTSLAKAETEYRKSTIRWGRHIEVSLQGANYPGTLRIDVGRLLAGHASHSGLGFVLKLILGFSREGLQNGLDTLRARLLGFLTMGTGNDSSKNYTDIERTALLSSF